MKPAGTAMWIVALAAIAGCGGTDRRGPSNDVVENAAVETRTVEDATPVEAEAESVAPVASIGSAKMKEDGTLVLQLRAEGDGIIGDAYITYEPDDPRYQETLDHLGGLKPGEEKPVPPWPADSPE